MFSNKELGDIVDQVRPLAVEIYDKLESIGKDIKFLELEFQKWGLNDFQLPISLNEYLYWNGERIGFRNIDEAINKPLIECKINVRIACEKYLTELAKIAAQQVIERGNKK